MTRINANIEPADLIDKHLLAEYRELIRIPNVVNKYHISKLYDKLKTIPKQFTLGTGHVLYFYDKQQFLHKRFLLLKQELSHRNIINNINDEMFLNVNHILYNDIHSADLYNGNMLIVNRIIERINTMKSIPTIKGININKEIYFNKLKHKYEQIN